MPLKVYRKITLVITFLSGINISIPSIIPTLALFTNSNIDGGEVEEFFKFLL
jgi:hypothetical protein